MPPNDCDPRDYIKKVEHEEFCEKQWDKDGKWKEIVSNDLRDMKTNMSELTTSFAVMKNTMETIRSIVYGAVGLVAISFLGTLIYLIGWRIK
jgi:hypothetical protein